MNITRINPFKTIRSLYYANRPFEYKEKEYVKIPWELEDDIYNKITPELKSMKDAVKVTDTPIKFASNKNGTATLMNFGPFSTIFDNNLSQKEVAEKINELIEKVKNAIGQKSYHNSLEQKVESAEKIMNSVKTFVSKLVKLIKF